MRLVSHWQITRLWSTAALKPASCYTRANKSLASYYCETPPYALTEHNGCAYFKTKGIAGQILFFMIEAETVGSPYFNCYF